MTEADDLVERLCVAAGMIIEDTAEAALVASATPNQERRIALLLTAGRDIEAIATAANAIARRYEQPRGQ